MGGGQDDGERLRLENVRDEDLGRLLVEAKLLLEHERVVDGAGEREKLLDDDEGEDEDDGLRNLAAEPDGREAEEQVARPCPQLGQHVALDEGQVLDLAPEAVDELELGLGPAIGLALVEHLVRPPRARAPWAPPSSEDLVLAQREEAFEDVLRDGEADYQLLPGEERAVEEPGEELAV